MTDFALRKRVDRLSVLPGVSQVIIGGGRRYAMRIWLDAERMAARKVTVSHVVTSLRRKHLELPGGHVETGPPELTVRTNTKLSEPAEFETLAVRDESGYQLPPRKRPRTVNLKQRPREGSVMGDRTDHGYSGTDCDAALSRLAYRCERRRKENSVQSPPRNTQESSLFSAHLHRHRSVPRAIEFYE